MPKEEVTRKKRIRGGHRSSVKRLVSMVHEIPHSPEHFPKLDSVLKTLREKEGVLRELNDDILAVVSDDDIDEEIETADEFSHLICSTITSLELSISKLNLASDKLPQKKGCEEYSTQSDEGNPNDITTSFPEDPGQEDDSQNSAFGQPPDPTLSSISPNQRFHPKLPKLTMKKFNGNVENWTTFWDSFQATIHNNPHLPDIDKFNYLNSLVKGDAAQAIGGLSLTSDNYNEAINILKKRFGTKDAIISKHLQTLMNFTVKDNGRDIRKLYDTVEAHVRALRSLGVPSQNYGCMLQSVILDKLPEDIRLILVRDLKGEDWKFDSFMEALSQEVEARERSSVFVKSKPSSSSSNESYQSKTQFQNYKPKSGYQQGTATALFTTNESSHTQSRHTCTYCHGSHPSNKCYNVTSIEARKQYLRRGKRCYICLKRDHFGRNCEAKGCRHCDQRHHTSLCPNLHPMFNPGSGYSNQRPVTQRGEYSYQQPQNNSYSVQGQNIQPCRSPETPGNQNDRSSQNWPLYCPPNKNYQSQLKGGNYYYQSSPQEAQQSNNGMVLHVATDTPVLLQTAQCMAFSPLYFHRKVIIRLLLDCGSQRSYITVRIKEFLNLPIIGHRDIIIKTFGSVEETKQTVDVTQLNIHSYCGDITLTAFVVPIICAPLTCQPLNEAKRCFPQLCDSQFADYSTDDCMTIDMLIGCDQYWTLVSGGIIRGERGISAISTKLGFVLSGPVHFINTDSQQNTNLTITHVLKCQTQLNEPCVSFPSKCDLDEQLHKFWELESLGINSRSVYEDLCDSISFKDGRYEVHLPWKTPHRFLPDNYASSLKRFNSLMRRLHKEPEILYQYNQVIQDQLKSGILELVDTNNTGELGKTHYLPHHAVVRTDKETTKLRIVYDASAHDQGPSLNSCLQIGEPLIQNILNILLRFRINKIGLTGDIEKAFLMISVAEKDRDVLRFLWVKDIYDQNSQLITLRFARVAFGVSSSPFLLNATIKFHMEQYMGSEPDFVRKFLNSIYVDDLGSGADTVIEAYDFYSKSKNILAEASFNMMEFVTNSVELRELIKCNESQMGEPDEHKSCQQFVSNEDQTYAKLSLGSIDSAKGEQKILGVKWNFEHDLICFDLKEIADLSKVCLPTKRNVVSLASKIFDPFGYLSPITIQIKMLFQELCKADYDWDSEIIGDLLETWHGLAESMQVQTVFVMPRCRMDFVTHH